MTLLEAPHARAVFVDKDGTLVYAAARDGDPDRVELLPRVGEGLRLLQTRGICWSSCRTSRASQWGGSRQVC